MKTHPKRPRKVLRRGIYLLPSAFTISNILLGFYAVVSGLRGDFQKASVLVVLAGILDALDGRIARMTGTDSEFGKEFDSLADVLTFGGAPALLTYLWGLENLGRIGWLIPLYYLVCAATRLARFNVQTRSVDSRWFVGLPAPGAAASLCAVLFFASNGGLDGQSSGTDLALKGLVLTALVVVGTLMVPTFRYWSFKRIDLKRRWSYRIALPLAAGMIAVALHPPAFFLVLAVLYTASGPVSWLWSRLRAIHRRSGSHRAEAAGGEASPPHWPPRPPAPASPSKET